MICLLSSSVAAAQEKTPRPAVTPSPAVSSSEVTSSSAVATLNASFAGSVATVVPTSGEPGASKIDELKWDTSRPIPVSFQDEMTEVRLYTTVSGTYLRDEWALIHESNRISPRGNKFEVKVLLEGKITQVDLIAVGPEGELQKERILVVFEKWDEYQTSRSKLRGGKRWAFTPGVGVTYVSYSQPKHEPLTELALTVKASLQFVIKPPNWDVATTVFYTALPLTTTPADSHIQFLGVNLRIGYVLPFVPDPWRVSIQTGGYYNTVTSAPTINTARGEVNRYGYQNIFGPQIFPSVRRVFANGDSATAYLKYSPVMYETSFLDIRNREIALGIGWARTMRSGFLHGKNVFVSVDIADLGLYKRPTDEEGVVCQSATLGVGIGF